ncbi:hypothetical protein OAB54_07520 [Flavobacteriaceae bacterium]|nr:hypothetical protein [Flavobacteriaceae bacterium]
MNHSEILDLIISRYFKNYDFDLKGKLEWYPVTEKQKDKHFKRTGKYLTSQRRSYKINKEFWVNPKSKKETSSSNYHQILISDIEEDDIFYCITDFRMMGNMGHKNRYKFKILNYNQLINISDVQFELLDKEMIMIR